MNTEYLETVWTGATWRTFPQPHVGHEPDRNWAAEIRQHLSKHQETWMLAKDVARAIGGDAAHIQRLLWTLVARGDVEKSRVIHGQDSPKPQTRLVYRWLGKSR